MKLYTALLTLTLLGESRGQCPTELTGVETITSTMTMYYELVLPDSAPGMLCARIEAQSEAWLGWGINPSGEMIGGESVIGLPDEGTVLKYNLFAESMDGVVAMDDALQTLMETSIVQENGMTIMSFAKYLDEDQYGIFESGRPNSFIWAVGSSNSLGYHADRGNFELEFAGADATSTSSSSASVTTSPFVTSSAGSTVMGFTEGNVSLTSAPSTSEVSTDKPVAAITAPTYSPTIGDVITTYAPTSDSQAATTGPSVVMDSAVQGDSNETDAEVTDSVTTSPSISEEASEEWTTPSPSALGNGTSATTPSPSVIDSSATDSSATTRPTTASTESSTSNSTASSTQSSTESSTSNSTTNGTESKSEDQFSPGDFASGAEANASRETGNSAMSSRNMGGIVLSVAALAIVFGF